jgi:hypothetical protein
MCTLYADGNKNRQEGDKEHKIHQRTREQEAEDPLEDEKHKVHQRTRREQDPVEARREQEVEDPPKDNRRT